MSANLSQNSILRLADEDTLRLLEYYQQERCLWDTDDLNYRNRMKRLYATRRIALKLGVKHFQEKHVVMKIKNIRNSYCQELKKIANSENSLEAGETVYQPRVVWFNKLDSFLRPHLHQTAAKFYKKSATLLPKRKQVYISDLEDSSTNIVKSEEIEVSDKSDYDGEEDFQGSRQESGSLNELFNEGAPVAKRCRLDNNGVIQSVASMSAPPLVSQVMHSCIEQNQSTPILHDIATCLKSLASKEQDVFDRFGSYVASMLRSLPSSRALTLQPKIVALLVEDTTTIHGSKPQNSNNT